MRITGGLCKGRILSTPKGRFIRPTADRVREAIFNILGQDLSGYHVLDLFSGTGCLGLEALSRGAKDVVFIDNLSESIDLIKKNLVLCGYQGSGVILKRDLTRGIPRGNASLDKVFDLVFLDPLLEEISTGERLSDVARVVIETAKTARLPVSFSDLETVDTRNYGDTKISIYELRK